VEAKQELAEARLQQSRSQRSLLVSVGTTLHTDRISENWIWIWAKRKERGRGRGDLGQCCRGSGACRRHEQHLERHRRASTRTGAWAARGWRWVAPVRLRRDGRPLRSMSSRRGHGGATSRWSYMNLQLWSCFSEWSSPKHRVAPSSQPSCTQLHRQFNALVQVSLCLSGPLIFLRREKISLSRVFNSTFNHLQPLKLLSNTVYIVYVVEHLLSSSAVLFGNSWKQVCYLSVHNI
jgi:hypothetical protein